MNKTILKLAYCAATVSLFTACASDDSFSESEAQNYVERAMKEDIASPIALGGATKSTITMESKSVLDSDPATQFFQTDGTNQWFGLFMVATSQIPLADGSSNYLTIDWSKNPVTVNGVERTNTWSVYTGDPDNASQGIDNLKTGARFINADGQRVSTLAEAAATRLYWSDAVERYYPIGNYHKYSFYGYYPYNSKQGAVKYTDKEIYVDFDYLDGTQDVIWGAARPTVEGVDIPDSLMYLAYSAKFFRYKANRDANDRAIPPVMHFKHKMMMLTFQITAGGTPLDNALDQQNYNPAYATQVSDISITNVASKIRLYIATDKDRADMAAPKSTHYSGDVVYSIEGSERKASYYVMDSDGKKMSTVTPRPMAYGDPRKTFANQPDTITVGQGIILPALTPADMQGAPYEISLKLTKDDTTKSLLQPLSLTALNNAVTFEPGYKYNIILKIYSPELVVLDATCEPWKDGDNPFYVDSDGTIPIH